MERNYINPTYPRPRTGGNPIEQHTGRKEPVTQGGSWDSLRVVEEREVTPNGRYGKWLQTTISFRSEERSKVSKLKGVKTYILQITLQDFFNVVTLTLHI